MQEDDMNVLANLSKDDWRIRAPCIMVEFALKNAVADSMDKTPSSSTMNMSQIKSHVLDTSIAADISHPAKPWGYATGWTDIKLMEEFFRQKS
ncbi:unnamed protein product [Ranitomeya imitator]|uniref:PDEase domain-containing protein n=1 Tax=Ranitomeya imitator TaxID=111125 RepID=A0ABN9LXB9_9NEOB|nr:unnamed protein product [Ranitomeya imitator]